jgi:hypothetical protein
VKVSFFKASVRALCITLSQGQQEEEEQQKQQQETVMVAARGMSGCTKQQDLGWGSLLKLKRKSNSSSVSKDKQL